MKRKTIEWLDPNIFLDDPIYEIAHSLRTKGNIVHCNNCLDPFVLQRLESFTVDLIVMEISLSEPYTHMPVADDFRIYGSGVIVLLEMLCDERSHNKNTRKIVYTHHSIYDTRTSALDSIIRERYGIESVDRNVVEVLDRTIS